MWLLFGFFSGREEGRGPLLFPWTPASTFRQLEALMQRNRQAELGTLAIVSISAVVIRRVDEGSKWSTWWRRAFRYPQTSRWIEDHTRSGVQRVYGPAANW